MRHFASISERVIFTSTTLEGVQSVLEESGQDAKVIGFVADLSSSGGVHQLISQISSAGGEVNHLINGARNLENLVSTNSVQISSESFLSELYLGVVAPYQLSMGLSDLYGKNLLSIVSLGSQYGLVAQNPALLKDATTRNHTLHYGVSKAALSHLTKELAVILSPFGTRVNCVAFGGFQGRSDQQFEQRYAELVPNGRMLEGSEVIGPIEFLISEASSSVTGATLVADGGWTIW